MMKKILKRLFFLGVLSFIVSVMIETIVFAETTLNDTVYTITFDGNGFGNTICELQVKSGDTLHKVLRELSMEDGWHKIMPEDFYYDGSKWYQVIDYTYDKSGDNNYDFDAPVINDITIYAVWYPIIPIDKVDVKIEPPTAGTVISFSEDIPYNYPDVSIPNDVGYEINIRKEYGTPYLYWYEGPSRDKVFEGTMEAGVTYYADVWLVPKSNEYAFTKDVTVTINSGDIEYEDGKFADFLVAFLVPVTAVEPEEESSSGDTFTLTFDGNEYLGKILEVEFKSGDSFWDVVDSLSAEDNEKIFPNDVYYDGTTYYYLGDYCYDKSGEEICDYYAPIDKDATIYALWYPIEDFIEHIDLTIEAPVAGTEVTMSDKYGFTQKPSPVITIPEGVKYEIDHNSQRQHVYWYEDASGEKLFMGTMEAGKIYYVKTWFKPISYDYVFAKDVDITVNSGDIISKNEKPNLFYARTLIPVVAVKTEVEPSGGGYSSGSGGGSHSSSYKITTKIENGAITPANPSIKKNNNQEFIFKANKGYKITDVLIDGKSVGEIYKYSLEKVTAKHTIEVKTEKLSSLSSIDDWVKEEMAKAEEKGLIPETFSSMNATKPITRLEFAAVAVKMYEAISGKKAEPVAVNPFTDTNDEYVLKAYALGITFGTSKTTFTPNAEITREQMATMLTRALNKAGINTEYDITNATRFADDSKLNDWGRSSVYFMAKNEIIKGVGDNRFNGLGNAKVEEAIVVALRSVDVFAK